MMMIMTDQGSITSSSSDVLTLTTASSWCAIPASTRMRVVRLIRPHTRRMLVAAPDCHPAYGFAVRGGKEFGTGFFVSSVERSSEADLKGLRVGDQILRINGFRVEDAVHKEFVQYVTSQDRITVKVRGVGMLPIQDKDSDRLSWHVVKVASISSTPSECSYKSKSTLDRDNRCKDISVVLNVAPRTKLGLGICKGPEWKPGIFVQFTKDKSVAREAGLRPGDQILSVNSIDFSDVLFSEAVAVMKSSIKLEMMVRTAAGCDLFPGESSGYNSSASSVTGDQSPCWADAKSKRLTAVREEMPTAAGWSEPMYTEGAQRTKSNASKRQVPTAAAAAPKEVNKTIIKLSESGTSINNTYVANAKMPIPQEPPKITGSADAVAAVPPPPPPVHLNVQFSAADNLCEAATIVADVHGNATPEASKTQNHNIYVIKSSTNTTTADTATLSAAAVATAIASAKKLTAAQAPFFNGCRNNAAANGCDSGSGSKNVNNNTLGGGVGYGSSLSSAIAEELKKRKEKQRSAAAMATTTATATSAAATGATAGVTIACNNKRPNNCIHNNNISNIGNNNKMNYSNTGNEQAVPPRGRAHGAATTASGGNQHTALMDEFMSFHQRMFKNGFHESEQERQEALKRTAFMEDDVNHRSSRYFNTKTQHTEGTHGKDNTDSGAQNEHQWHLPPPPPLFANSAPKSNSQSTVMYKTPQKSHARASELKPPSSPEPDYDGVQLRSTMPRPMSAAYPNTKATTLNSRESTKLAPSRHTMRLGTVTIGQYEEQRKEPGKFDFISTTQRSSSSNNNNNNINGTANGNDVGKHNTDSLHCELQSTLSRSNLKKTNGYGLEHQTNCPLKNAQYEQYQSKNYANIEFVTRKMQDAGLENDSNASDTGTLTPKANGGGTGTGILKNGTRNRTSSITRQTEKSIKFGN